MKLADVLIISLSVVFLIIGIHQVMVLGFGSGYWAIMISTILFFVLVYRRKK